MAVQWNLCTVSFVLRLGQDYGPSGLILLVTRSWNVSRSTFNSFELVQVQVEKLDELKGEFPSQELYEDDHLRVAFRA